MKLSWHKPSKLYTFIILTRSIMIPNYNLNNMCKVKTKAMGFMEIRACVRWGKCGLMGIMENYWKTMWGILKMECLPKWTSHLFLNAPQKKCMLNKVLTHPTKQSNVETIQWHMYWIDMKAKLRWTHEGLHVPWQWWKIALKENLGNLNSSVLLSKSQHQGKWKFLENVC